MKKIMNGMFDVMMVILAEILVQIIYPIIGLVLWLVTMPIKVVVLITKSNKLCKDLDDYNKDLEELRESKITRYSLIYLCLLVRYKIADKIGWCL